MTSILSSIFLLLISRVFSLPTEYSASIQAMPPNVSVQPISEKQMDGTTFSASQVLSNSLFRWVLDESDNKRRVQRYRDI